MKCSVVRVACSSPNDTAPLQAAVDQGLIVPSEVIGVLGKTEGNGCVNDFTRGYAVQTLKAFFARYSGEEAGHISYVMSGGTEGVLSPHFTVFSRTASPLAGGKPEVGQSATGQKSLAIGVSRTPAFEPEELGRMAQVEQVAEAVRRTMKDADIRDAADVHFVQIKCPLLTGAAVQQAKIRGKSVVTEETYKSMGYSRGASALGAAIALGEVDKDSLTEADICVSWEKYSSVASTSAGTELDYCEVIVFGNSFSSEGPLYIDHSVMKDAIDADALRRLLEANSDAEVVQVLAKAEADPTGSVRGKRHTMLDDSDINHTRYARAVVGGVLASVCGDPMIYVSGGAEHQGPAGGGPVAVIFKRS